MVSPIVVTCPPPEKIERGYMSSNDKRKYDYMETIKYGCHGDFVIEGSQEIVCQKYGNWSEKPSCKGTNHIIALHMHTHKYINILFPAPCSVGIHRGRILYRGQRLWIKELTPNRILHNELVSVYCLNKERNCGYAVSTQCTDGNLKIPECFEGRLLFTALFFKKDIRWSMFIQDSNLFNSLSLYCSLSLSLSCWFFFSRTQRQHLQIVLQITSIRNYTVLK